MKKIRKLILLAAGVLAIILGIVSFGKDAGSYESNLSYGGDAYTGIQNASAQAANNTMYLAEITRFGFGSVLLVGGLVLVSAGIASFEKEKDEEKTQETVLRDGAPANPAGDGVRSEESAKDEESAEQSE